MKILLSMLMISLFSLSFLNASEEVPTELEVAKLYVATFNRAPDSGGLTYWIDSGLSLSDIAQSFFDQTETREFYPEGTSYRDFVRSVYLNLFNREPDTLGWDYWENELVIGTFSRNSMIQAVINGAKNSDTSNDLDILSNKSTVGLHFANQGLEDPTEARSIMSSITADVSTVNSARDTINLTGARLVSSPSGKLVDPYIEGAILCEDVNANDTCDEGERVSSATTADGDFAFTDTLTPGTKIIIKIQGAHLGETYDLDLAAVVADDGSVQTVSPLTTLASKEITDEQIAAIINSAAQNAGVSDWSDISASDISIDPLEGDLLNKPAANINDADLRKILVNMSVYGLIRVMKGSTELSSLSGNELYISGITSGSAVNKIATFMLQNLTQFLNSSLLSQMNSTISQAKDTVSNFLLFVPGGADIDVNTIIPVVNASEVIYAAVVFMDRFATLGYTVCNATQGDADAKISAALSAVAESISIISSETIDVGVKIYSLRNGARLSPFADYLGMLNLPSISQGYNDYVAGYGTYRFNDNNQLVAQ